MFFVVLGCLLLGMKYFELGPVTTWSWWLVLAPFGLAVLWWWYADASGYTKRREMDRMEDRKAERRRTSMERLGLKYRSADKTDRRAQKALEARRREIEKIEGKRTAKRMKDRDSILGSRFDSQQDASRPGKPDA
jgi:small Trp-rich protein